MQQIGLIERVLKATGLQDCNPDKMPASQKPLGTDKNGLEFVEQWSYSSVVGMLLYLADNSHPEIAYVVHQCAWFTHNPKAPHRAAMKRICRYLQGTKTKGLILKPSKQLTVDCFVDADFAGQWNGEILKTLCLSNHRWAMFFLLGTVLSNGFQNCKVKSRFL